MPGSSWNAAKVGFAEISNKVFAGNLLLRRVPGRSRRGRWSWSDRRVFVAERFARLIQLDMHIQNIRQCSVALLSGQLFSALRCINGFGKSPRLSISRRQHPDNHWILAAGKPDRLFGQRAGLVPVAD